MDAYLVGGLISSKNSKPVTIRLKDGTTTECTFENLYERSKSCPKGWTGKADEESCYKIETEYLTNNAAAKICSHQGADLLQVETITEDNFIIDILQGSLEYSIPFHPGFYHLGMYQRQSGNQYYHRNGARV